jgi:hypothetical protein
LKKSSKKRLLIWSCGCETGPAVRQRWRFGERAAGLTARSVIRANGGLIATV